MKARQDTEDASDPHTCWPRVVHTNNKCRNCRGCSYLALHGRVAGRIHLAGPKGLGQVRACGRTDGRGAAPLTYLTPNLVATRFHWEKPDSLRTGLDTQPLLGRAGGLAGRGGQDTQPLLERAWGLAGQASQNAIRGVSLTTSSRRNIQARAAHSQGMSPVGNNTVEFHRDHRLLRSLPRRYNTSKSVKAYT